MKIYNIKAAFFVLGANSWNPSILQQIVADGHLIASHGWSHTNVLTIDNSMVLKEIKDTENAIKSATGATPQHFRPPFGNFLFSYFNRFLIYFYIQVQFRMTKAHIFDH